MPDNRLELLLNIYTEEHLEALKKAVRLIIEL